MAGPLCSETPGSADLGTVHRAGGRGQSWHLQLTEYGDSCLGHRVRRGGKMETCLAIFQS